MWGSMMMPLPRFSLRDSWISDDVEAFHGMDTFEMYWRSIMGTCIIGLDFWRRCRELEVTFRFPHRLQGGIAVMLICFSRCDLLSSLHKWFWVNSFMVVLFKWYGKENCAGSWKLISVDMAKKIVKINGNLCSREFFLSCVFKAICALHIHYITHC